MTARHASVRLPASRSAPLLARRFVTNTLHAWSIDALGQLLELVVSELVTNAVCHAQSPSRVALSDEGTVVRVEVADRGPGGVQRRVPGSHAMSGRGLFLVEAMAERWGASHNGEEHVVWCEVAK